MKQKEKSLQERINLAIEILQEPRGACKGCEATCGTNIILRVLRGEPATLCPICDEWWHGPIEYDWNSEHNEIKMIECPECIEFSKEE